MKEKLSKYLEENVYICQDTEENEAQDIHDSLSTVVNATMNFLEQEKVYTLLSPSEIQKLKLKENPLFEKEAVMTNNFHYFVPMKYLSLY